MIKDPLKNSLINPKERQTYYGALNLLTQEFILIPYQIANGELTVEFVLTLQAKNPEARILLIWDGASYHKGQEMKSFPSQQNEVISTDKWKIICCRFAPYAPQKNSVEVIWLPRKTLLRRF